MKVLIHGQRVRGAGDGGMGSIQADLVHTNGQLPGLEGDTALGNETIRALPISDVSRIVRCIQLQRLNSVTPSQVQFTQLQNTLKSCYVRSVRRLMKILS